MPEIKRSLAVIIGINQYVNGIPTLETAVSDAQQLAKILTDKYQYEVLLLLDTDATLSRLGDLLAAFTEKILPFSGENKVLVEADDRILFYFAGHGEAPDPLDISEGPAGYLIPQNAQRDDRTTWLPMQRLHDALIQLPCRHLLIVLDCCKAGTFRWATRKREAVRSSQKVYREIYNRYTAGYAQQVITSAAYDEKAADSLDRFSKPDRGISGHSPFAELLFEGLNGSADITKDGVITATELYLYLDTELGKKIARQTPGISEFGRHDKGQYIFSLPGFDRDRLELSPTLDENTNPYKGLDSFEPDESDKFYGRKNLTEKLVKFVEQHQLTVVSGASGLGKSSLVKAGLIPQLKKSQPGWLILPPIRPGKSPFSALNDALEKANFPILEMACQLNNVDSIDKTINHKNTLWYEQVVEDLSKKLNFWVENHPDSKLLLVIDQFEELVTANPEGEEGNMFLKGLAKMLKAFPDRLRVVVTLRDDFEYLFSHTALQPDWKAAQFDLLSKTTMTREDLREIIVEPATAKVIYFEPPSLVDTLIDEVMQMPGGLPLLSFTLSALYLKYIDSLKAGINSDRAITQADYDELGGVAKSLTKRADEEYEKLVQGNNAYDKTIRNVMLRMVAIGGSELARRQLLDAELVYPETQENARVKEVIKQFCEARLLVRGKDINGNSYTEPAHDILVRRWPKLQEWKRENEGKLILQRQLTPIAQEWKNKAEPIPSGFQGNVEILVDWCDRTLEFSEKLGNKVIGKLVGLWPWTPGVRKVAKKQQEEFLWHTNPRLDLLEEVFTSSDNWLNQIENEFVDRSIDRKKNIHRRKIFGGFIVFIFLVGFAGIQRYQKQQAQIKSFTESSQNYLASGQNLDALIAGLTAAKKLQTLKILGLAEANTQMQLVAALGSAFYAVRESNFWNHDGGGVHSVSFSPDGEMIATASADKTVNLWKRDGTLQTTLIGHSAPVRSVSFSPDGEVIATASVDKTVKLWKRDGTLRKTLNGHLAVVSSVSFSPDGQIIASASWDSTVKLWNRDGSELVVLKGHSKPVSSVSFSPDSQMIASASWDKTVKLWKRDGTFVKNLGEHDAPAYSVSFSPDGQTIASASTRDNTVKLWKPDGRKPITLTGHKALVYSVSFSPDGQMIASASADQTVKLWKRDGTLLHTLTGHQAAVTSISFSPDGQTIASASADSTVKLWKWERTGIKTLTGHREAVLGVSFSPDGQTIASAGWDKTVKLWKRDGSELDTLKRHTKEVYSVSFSPDGQTIASASADKTVKLWKRDGTLLNTLKGHTEPVYSVSFSPDGEIIASASDDKTIKLWKRDGTFLRTLNGHSAAVNSVSFSPDGQTIASAGWDSTVKLWKLDGTFVKTLAGHSDTVRGVSFSPDGQIIASASWDNTVKLWKLDGTLQNTLTGHGDRVWDVSFSPDGQIIASSSADNTVKLWKRDGTLLATLIGHSNTVNMVSFSPDGKTLASAGQDGTVILWNLERLDIENLLRHGCDWVQDYLNNSANLSQEDRKLCDGIGNSRR